MNKDIQSDSIPSLDPILKAALNSLDLQAESEIERYERFKNIMANIAQPHNHSPISHPQTDDSQLQTKALALAKKQANSSVKLPSFPHPVVTPSPNDAIKQRILALVHQPQEKHSNIEPQTDPTIPDDYLESSENLLRTLHNENSQENKSQGLKSLTGVKESLFTPFGAASFLMLLSAVGLLFGYLGWNKLLNAESVSQVTNTKASPPANSQSPQNQSAEPVNLDLGTISTLNPNSPEFIRNTTSTETTPSQPTEKPVTAVEVTRGGSDLASALLPPSLRSQDNQTGVNSNPKPSEATNPVTNTSKPSIAVIPVPVPPPPAPNQQKKVTVNNKKTINQVKFLGDYYYVLVPNTDNKTLTQVRKIVKDAFLGQFPQGVRIQMGAFDNQKDAQDLVARLKKQGIIAEIYRSQ